MQRISRESTDTRYKTIKLTAACCYSIECEKYPGGAGHQRLRGGRLSRPLEPDPGNAGVGKRAHANFFPSIPPATIRIGEIIPCWGLQT